MCQSALLVQLLMVGHFHAIPCTRSVRVGVDSHGHISTDSESPDASSRDDIFGYLSGDKDMQKLRIKFYTSNEATQKASSFEKEYLAFKDTFNGDEDVVVTCQQEATASLHKSRLLQESKWQLVGHGSHWGMTGNGTNAQILNVFVRLDGNVTIARNPINWEKGQHWIAKRHWKGHSESRIVAWAKGGANTLIEASTVTMSNNNDVALNHTQIRPVIKANSRMHETSGTGKGGVTTRLSLSSGKRRAELVFICVHAASNPSDERERGMKQIWNEAIKDFPSADSIFVLGDLNYRLLDNQPPISSMLQDDPEGDSAIGKLLYSASDRVKFQASDQLSGKFKSVVTKTVEEEGLGLNCNEPFKHYMPTYRRNSAYKSACSTLNSDFCQLPSSEMDGCPFIQNETCSNQFVKAKQCEQCALACYFVGTEDLKSVGLEILSGEEIGFKTVVLNDGVTGKLYLMVWYLDMASPAWQAGIRPGFWITEIEESKSNPTEVRTSIKVADTYTKDADKDYLQSPASIMDKIQQFAEAKSKGSKMKITFAWTHRKWKRKENGMLQLGWLDRLCWKAMSSDAKIDLKVDQDIVGGFASDHVATHFLVEWTKGQEEAAKIAEMEDADVGSDADLDFELEEEGEMEDTGSDVDEDFELEEDSEMEDALSDADLHFELEEDGVEDSG